ncbi:hypothetical protein GCM10028799_27630 [Kribbella italica]
MRRAAGTPVRPLRGGPFRLTPPTATKCRPPIGNRESSAPVPPHRESVAPVPRIGGSVEPGHGESVEPRHRESVARVPRHRESLVPIPRGRDGASAVRALRTGGAEEAAVCGVRRLAGRGWLDVSGEVVQGAVGGTARRVVRWL